MSRIILMTCWKNSDLFLKELVLQRPAAITLPRDFSFITFSPL